MTDAARKSFRIAKENLRDYLGHPGAEGCSGIYEYFERLDQWEKTLNKAEHNMLDLTVSYLRASYNWFPPNWYDEND